MRKTSAPKPVVNIAEAPLQELTSPKAKFRAKLARLGPMLGTEKLGAMLTIVEPGKSAFPFHAHHAIEELFFIVEGTGSYRYGDQTFPVRSGDLLAAPTGGAAQAHQIVNTGDARLVFLAISTMDPVDIVEYPKTGKLRVYAQGEATDAARARLNHVMRRGSAVDLYDGEEE